MFPDRIMADIANAENRVQNPKMIRSGLSTIFPFSVYPPFFGVALWYKWLSFYAYYLLSVACMLD